MEQVGTDAVAEQRKSEQNNCCHVGSDGKCACCTSDETAECVHCEETFIASKAVRCKARNCDNLYCAKCGPDALTEHGYCADCRTFECNGCDAELEHGTE